MPVKADHLTKIETALSTGGAAKSAVFASWSRSAHLHGLDPTTRRKPERLDQAALAEARLRSGRMIRLANPVLDELFRAVGGTGACVLLADDDGIPVERRGMQGDDLTFDDWGLWLGAIWSEDHEGTNGIGTCIADGRPVMIRRDQHFMARNTGLSCIAAPIHDSSGRVAGVLDVSSARADLNEGYSRLIAHSVADAAVRIEVELFRSAFPSDRMVLLPQWLHGAAAGAVVAVDRDDIVVGLSYGARQALGLAGSIGFSPRPLADLLGQHVPDGFEDAERAVLVRAMARADGNVSAAARALGVSRATLHRKLGPMPSHARKGI